jgi:hypothetical protein
VVVVCRGMSSGQSVSLTHFGDLIARWLVLSGNVGMAIAPGCCLAAGCAFQSEATRPTELDSRHAFSVAGGHPREARS